MVGATARHPQTKPDHHETLSQTLRRMISDVIYFALTLLVAALLLKPLLIVAVISLALFLIWCAARLAYWFISLAPIWADPENPGRLHRWPAGVNLAICAAIGIGLWLILRSVLVSGLQSAATWLRGDAADMPKASAKVITVLDSLGDAALSAVAAIPHGFYWCLLKLDLVSDTWDTAIRRLNGCWHGLIDPAVLRLCPPRDSTPVTGAVTAPMASPPPAPPPGMTCQIGAWGLYDIAVLILLALACLYLFFQRKGEARRLRDMERLA